MPHSDEATTRSIEVRGGDTLSAPTPALVVLFHSDFRMLGRRTVPGFLETNAVRTLGRSTACFQDPLGEDGAPLVTLSDPCVSRACAELRWVEGRAEREGLRVTPLAGSRPALVARDPDGDTVPLPGVLPEGSTLELEGRVLLGVTRSPGNPAPVVEGLVGEDAVMHTLRRGIAAAAASKGGVLILGPTGAGKEVVAQAIHARDPRRDARPGRSAADWTSARFVALNCAAIPRDLAESELFGRTRGAFTGATDADGAFRAANGGTLLLDEIGDLELSIQAKLLRALETRTVRPLGARDERTFDAHVLAATNIPLGDAVAAGRFRADLLFRLNEIELHVPALSARPFDVPLLLRFVLASEAADAASRAARILLAAASELSAPLPLDQMRALLAHPWPGNVRELKRVVGRIVAHAAHHEDFRGLRVLSEPTPDRAPVETVKPVESMTPERIRAALEGARYIKARAAERLGIARGTLDKLMARYGLKSPGELDLETIEAAVSAAGGDVGAAAQALRISQKGLTDRLKALGRSDG